MLQFFWAYYTFYIVQYKRYKNNILFTENILHNQLNIHEKLVNILESFFNIKISEEHDGKSHQEMRDFFSDTIDAFIYSKSKTEY